MNYVADFETTTNEKDCRVWGWGACNIDDEKEFYMGTTIEDFMELCEILETNALVYLHNLKFDGQFIISWLLNQNYKYVATSRERATRTFTTLISDKGLYYAIEVVFWRKGKNIKKVTFWDSAKLIPLSVEEIAEAFKMPIKKLSIDYAAHNNLPYGSPLNKEEEEYIKNDVLIVARAVKSFHDQGLKKMTIGSCALAEYKKLIGEDCFKRWFPPPKYHNDVKQAYKGGYTYLNPKYAGKTVKNGVVLDVNSIYSHVMKERLMPYGTPVFYKGKYEPDEVYPLYTQMIKCQFELKPGKLPTIQIKKSLFNSKIEYLTTSDDEILTLCLNSVDLELFLENYEIYNPEYISGWKFKAAKGMFDAYIDKWTAIKIKAKEEKNWSLYIIAKLFLNALYGRFGMNTKRKTKIPYMDPEGVLHYKDSEETTVDGIYVPVASFVTSYAREYIVRAAQKIIDAYESGKSNIQYIYSDTDSLHLESEDFSLPEGLEIDPVKLGAFKFESKFQRAKYLRQKCYIQQSTEDVYNPDPEYNLKVTVAGMPKDCHDAVNFKNFKIGAFYEGKKKPKLVPGGVILENIDFTINP